MDANEIAHLIAPIHAASWKSAYRGIFSDEYLNQFVDEDRLANWRNQARDLIENDGEIFLATVAGESRDQIAVNHIMGHSGGAADDMPGRYRERISDERLLAVAEHVRSWLFDDQGKSGAAVGYSHA